MAGPDLPRWAPAAARQFQDPGLVADIQRVLAASGLEPASLKLEITESATMQDQLTALLVERRVDKRAA